MELKDRIAHAKQILEDQAAALQTLMGQHPSSLDPMQLRGQYRRLHEHNRRVQDLLVGRISEADEEVYNVIPMPGPSDNKAG